MRSSLSSSAALLFESDMVQLLYVCVRGFRIHAGRYPFALPLLFVDVSLARSLARSGFLVRTHSHIHYFLLNDEGERIGKTWRSPAGQRRTTRRRRSRRGENIPLAHGSCFCRCTSQRDDKLWTEEILCLSRARARHREPTRANLSNSIGKRTAAKGNNRPS